MFLAGCAWFEPTVTLTKETVIPLTDDTNNSTSTTVYRAATADQISLAMLTPEDIAAQVDNASPLPIEFNGQLHPDLQNAVFHIAQQWNDGAGYRVVGDSITQYSSAETAQADVAVLASDCNQATEQLIGDVTYICYTEPLLYFGGPSDPAYITYRVVLGQYGIHINVVDTGEVFDDNNVIYDRLNPIAYNLTSAQVDRLQTVLADEQTALANTAALQMLPDAPIGTTVLGTAAVTIDEWLTLSGLDVTLLDGFTSGAIRRFVLTDRPDEVLEVVVIEFASADQAQRLVDAFTTPPAESGIVESQFVQANYVYDISMYSPFEELDPKASADLTSYSNLILQ